MKGASAILAALVAVRSLAAQGVAAGVHGQLGSPTRWQYSLGWITPRWTIFEATLGATWIHADDGDRYGGQIDLSIGESTRRRWYGVASIAGGPSGGDAEVMAEFLQSATAIVAGALADEAAAAAELARTWSGAAMADRVRQVADRNLDDIDLDVRLAYVVAKMAGS